MSIKKNVLAHIPHSNLSSKIWDKNKNMHPEFRAALIKISDAFIDY